MNCPTCGTNVGDDSIYCTGCGDHLSQTGTAGAPDDAATGHVSRPPEQPVEAKSEDTSTGELVPGQSDPASSDAETSRPSPDDDPTDRCPSCGTPVVNDMRFCTECGAKAPNATTTTEDATQGNDMANSCAHCGAAIEANDSFCTRCGQRVDVGPTSTLAALARQPRWIVGVVLAVLVIVALAIILNRNQTSLTATTSAQTNTAPVTGSQGSGGSTDTTAPTVDSSQTVPPATSPPDTTPITTQLGNPGAATSDVLTLVNRLTGALSNHQWSDARQIDPDLTGYSDAYFDQTTGDLQNDTFVPLGSTLVGLADYNVYGALVAQERTQTRLYCSVWNVSTAAGTVQQTTNQHIVDNPPGQAPQSFTSTIDQQCPSS
jgi:hypothetical protein